MNRPTPPMVDVRDERDRPDGLAFTVRFAGPPPQAIELRLHWADYNLWSPDGSDAPERIALAVATVAWERLGGEHVPDPLDAAVLRRRWPDADDAIASRLRSNRTSRPSDR